MNIFNLPRTEEEAIKSLQSKGILPAKRTYPNGHKMTFYFGNEIFWKCNTRPCQKKINIRKSNWFVDTRLSFATTVRFLYCWAKELTSIKWCKEELEIADKTAIDSNNYMRETAVALLFSRRRNQKIGGEGMVVEIDESMFTKRKNNAGRVLPQQWIFGGICRETHQCFLLEVPNRKATTLLAAIKDNIAEGSIIYSDSWRDYRTTALEETGFEHFKVNHKYNFVDSEASVHTQTVERMWRSTKWRNKRHRGTERHHLESYLAEFMWRQMIKDDGDVFESLLEAVAEFWPPESQM